VENETIDDFVVPDNAHKKQVKKKGLSYIQTKNKKDAPVSHDET
jgi:hypothetical protein